MIIWQMCTLIWERFLSDRGIGKKAESFIHKAKKIFNAEMNRAGVFKCNNLLGAILGEKRGFEQSSEKLYKIITGS